MPTYQIPSPVNQALIISRYELLIHLRSKKILGIIAITVVFSVLFIGLFENLGAQGLQILGFDLALPISFVSFLIVIVAAFFGSSSISSEFNQNTGYVLFSNPVSRTSIWFGKFIATEIIAFSVIVLYYSIIVSYVAMSHEIPIQIIISLLFSFISSTMIMSIAFLISSIFRGQTSSAILVFALFIIIFPMIDGIMVMINGEKPWFTPTFSSGIIKYVLTVPYPIDGNMINIPFFTNSFVPKIIDSLGVMVSYIVTCVVLSVLIFKRKELA